MKPTGIIRRIDDLGRIVIPREIRRTLNLKEGDPLELFLEKDMLCFQKYCVEESYIEKIQSLLDKLNEDEDMENSAEIKSKLNEVLELFNRKDGNDGKK